MANQYDRRGGTSKRLPAPSDCFSARFNTNPFLLVKHYNDMRNQRLDFLTLRELFLAERTCLHLQFCLRAAFSCARGKLMAANW